MNLYLEIQNKNNKELDFEKVELNVSTEPYDINNLTDCKIVYTDKDYVFKISKDIIQKSSKFTIRINDEENEIELRKCIEEEKVYQFFVKKPFNLIYGLISIEILTEDNVFFSELLISAVNDNFFEKNKNSLLSMLEEILSSKHGFLKTGSIYSPSQKNISQHKNLNLKDEIKLMNDIAFIYDKMYSSFSINPYTKSSHTYVVDKTDKLNCFDSKIIQFMAENIQELRYHNAPTGIMYNKIPIVPEKTLIKSKIKDINIYENQQVLGFLELIHNHINYRIKELKTIQNNAINPKNYNIKDYQLPSEIINLLIKSYNNNCESELVRTRQKILSVKNKYINCMSIKTEAIKTIPKPTPIFMGIFHYRQIFSVMQKWFSAEKTNIINPNSILNFPNASKIYEIYSLKNIIDYILEAGFILSDSKKFPYKGNRSFTTKFDNTFEFIRNNVKLVLYYQPKIVVNETPENGIELYRVDAVTKNRAFYPDFIIKTVEQNKDGTNLKYSILDSKWRTKNTIIEDREHNKTFENAIFKYYFSVTGKDNMHPISHLWLICGKDDGSQHNTIDYHIRNRQFDNNLKLKNRAGIVLLTPECNKKDFKEVIRFIINQ